MRASRRLPPTPPVARQVEVFSRAEVNRYLARLGATLPPRLDAQALTSLQRRHLLTVPFENLDIHAGLPIVLTRRALFDKVVSRRRGGLCYELNGAFAMLLASLGFDVELHGARVWQGGGWGLPLGHVTLLVRTPEPWLVDVGFGNDIVTALPYTPAVPTSVRDTQDDGKGLRLQVVEHGDVELRRDGRPLYLIESRPRALGDFTGMCWWHSTSPEATFTRSLVCSRATEQGRVTLAGNTLIETAHGERRQRALSHGAELLAAYRTYFDIGLSTPPRLRDSAEPSRPQSGRAP